jgi:addiction module HigA family antidote
MNTTSVPGEILLEEYLKPLGISQNAMNRAIGVPTLAINEIVMGKRAITSPMSILFGAFFGQSETFWLGIQCECDFRALAKEKKWLIQGITAARELEQA